MSAEDPYALHADGTAVDPRLFREAALADTSLAEDLRKDERASGVLASGDDAALQELDTLLRGFLGRGSCPKTGAGDPQQCQALETVLQSLAQRASALASKLSGSSSTSGAIDAG